MSGATSLEVLPETGALISYYRTHQADGVIDWLLPRSDQHPGSFVMIPFASRVAQGTFRFQDRLIKLKPNVAHESYPIHGYGWQRQWRVLERSDSSVLLRYVEDSGDWPWLFHADLTISLDGLNLSLHFEVVNHAREPMPVGFGVSSILPCY